jgi:hypothetical protein
MLYKSDGVRLHIACYSWEIASNIGLNVSFENMCDWKEMREKAGEVNST